MGYSAHAAVTASGAFTPTLIVRCQVPDGADQGRTIDIIGGVDEQGLEWHLPLDEAVRLADADAVAFFIRGPAQRRLNDDRVTTGPLIRLEVATSSRGTRYLRADAGHGARLSDLPRCTHDVQTPPRLDDGPLGRGCRAAVAYLQEHCPGLLPDRLDEGAVGAPLSVSTERTSGLVGTAAAEAVARAAATPGRARDELPTAVVWQDGTDELLVLLDSIRVATADGLITVSVDTACDEVPATRTRGRSRIDIDLVVGTAARPTGMLAAAPTPRGEPLIVQRWADPLVALAWRAVLDTAAQLGAAAGDDADGHPLIPAMLSADRAGITFVPQARFAFDRVAATS